MRDLLLGGDTHRQGDAPEGLGGLGRWTFLELGLLEAGGTEEVGGAGCVEGVAVAAGLADCVRLGLHSMIVVGDKLNYNCVNFG